MFVEVATDLVASHFRDDVTIETFQFEPARPGDRAILVSLAARLPRGAMADDFVDCLAGAIAANGVDGYFSELVVPVMVAAEFLAVRESSDGLTWPLGLLPADYSWHRNRTAAALADL